MVSKNRVQELIDEKLLEMPDLYLVDLKVGSDSTIKVELDHKINSISIDDCKMMSRHIEFNLDREEEDFSLEVSSPGINQAFKVNQQYVKNIGKELLVHVGDKKIEGKLTGFNQEKDSVKIETRRKERLENKKKKKIIIEEIEIALTDISKTLLKLPF